MNQRSGQHTTSGPGAQATARAPRRGKLLELARRLEDLGRRVEGFIDEQLVHLERAGALLQSQPEQQRASPEDVERLRDAWEREHREDIRKIDEDRRLLAEAWVRLEAEQRQVVAARDTKRDVPRSTRHENESGDDSANEAPRPVSQKKKKTADETKENGRPPMDPSMRQAMMRQFQQLRSDVRKYAQRRQQC
jgi:hypothetical protein